MKSVFQRYKELISYIVWGAATTGVNYAVYFLCTNLLHINYLVSNGFAWMAAVAFAFFVNKLFVFRSVSWNKKVVLAELWKFVSARIASGVLEFVLLFLFVDVAGIPDGPVKIAVGVIIVILNYIVSKLAIFKAAK